MLARRIGKERFDDLAPVVQDILMKTDRNAEFAKDLSDTLEPEFSTLEIEHHFANFARGIQYVSDKYSIVMGEWDVCFAISDHDGEIIRDAICYGAPPDDVFVITYEALEKQLGRYREEKLNPHISYGTGHTDSYELTNAEAVTLIGVEEAFHAFQFKRPEGVRQDVYLKQDTAEQQHLDYYKTNPVELEAGEVVRQAIKDFGFDGLPISR